MNRVIFPLNPDMTGSKVADLQDALQLFLDRGALIAGSDAARGELIAALQPEHAHQAYRAATRKLVGAFQEEHGLQVSGNVDQPTADTMNRLLAQIGVLDGEPRFVVRGTVRLSNGQPPAPVTVAAFDRDLRTEQLLGQQNTDIKGDYRISYVKGQFVNAEKGGADLVVRAFNAEGTVLAVSPTVFNALPDTEVDLTIPEDVLQPPALYDRIFATVAPLLQDVKIEQLQEDGQRQDITFLSGETGFDKSVLARFALAPRLGQDIEAQFWFVLLGSSFYKFSDTDTLDQQLQTVMNALPSLDEAYVRKALARGFNEKEIAPSFRDAVERWVRAFLAVIASRTTGDANRPTFVGQALQDAGITDVQKQQTFARLFNEQKAMTPRLLDALEREGSFSGEEIADLGTSFRIAEITRSDFSVVRVIKEQFQVRAPEELPRVAKASEEQWVNIVQQGSDSGAIKIPIFVEDLSPQARLPQAQIYGRMLEQSFREAFPTASFSGGLERAMNNGGPRGIGNAQALAAFLEQNRGFELLNTRIDTVDNVPGELKPQLKAVQRVFKLAPSFEAADALLADGIHSAQKVYRLGETEFVKRYAEQPGFTRETARLAWRRAADTHAAALTVVADLKAREGLPAALQIDASALDSFPNWNNLFTAGDLCQCEPCRSVLSPAAYFADLLMFLKDRAAKNPAQSVKDVLFKRRPDLGYLELDCENALTPFPYIDTVCEVLEDVVAAGENDAELPGFSAMPADPVAARGAVAGAFAGVSLVLGDDFTLSQVDAADPDRWVVHGDEASFLLKKKAPSPNFFAEVLRNTKASAGELRAYPQYVNPKAYLTLRRQKYPLALPFDLFAEEVRAAFRKSNLSRWDLMETMRGPAAPNEATEGEAAAEYFGISADPAAPFDEFRLILVADATVAGQQALWGETGPDWLALVGNVRSFLKKTGLSYQELAALLDLKFINPDGDIVIHHLDPSCDTDKQVIEVLDETKLDRMQRFLRLWAKLDGWQMWELDLVLRAQAIGNGSLDEPFLINLYYFSRLKKRLGIRATVEQVALLFGNLDIETRFTRLHEKRADALYQTLFLNKRLINPLDPAFQLDPVTDDLPAGALIADHHPVLLAALGVREADLLTFVGLTKSSDGTPYLDGSLTLANLSFLYRHAWLARLLKYSADDWRILLKLFQQDIASFADPKAAWELVDSLDRLVTLGFKPDQLDWILAANRSAKAAVKESDASRFLLALRKELQSVQKENDPAQFPFLNAVPPTDADSLTALLTALLQKLGRTEIETRFFLDTLANLVSQERLVIGLPPGFDFPAPIKNSIAIRYDDAKTTLRFTGLMTAAQRTTLLTDPSLGAVTGMPAYQQAIGELFLAPRLALKFFQPLFFAPLANLPATVDFSTLSDPALALKIGYDAELRLLTFAGIMTGAQKDALDALSADAAYRSAINSLAGQPDLVAPPDERIWLLEPDLKFPLAGHLPENLATAAKLALGYLSKTLSQGAVVQQAASALGLSEAVTRSLLSFPLLPQTILDHLSTTFAATSGVVDYATLKSTFDAWCWANRVAVVWKKWKTSLADLQAIMNLITAGQLLEGIPLDDSGPIASLPRFIRTGRLIRLRDSLPETSITLFEVLEKLKNGAYPGPADFAADVELLNDAWSDADVLELVSSLDLNYPADYLLTETWERLRRAFYFIESLNASAASAKEFAAAAMGPDQAGMAKDLLRSKFGADTWLELSAEIQDVLREKKRDALVAYLLAQPQPSDAPSGKWENSNDLYAYYLLDVEMTSCLLTSRLVQGSGSIQLFVQRCFMGLEPDVEVRADGDQGDSAWRWWKWMSKYRVWEANRKVFLWPENWIEPELKKDRSPFFKELETDLLKNEVNQFTVEDAFASYLGKLDSVAQLELAGFYQEDDADLTRVHVFGRSKKAEPHVYYYRTYDYRFWSPWVKVELDIQGDYLIPAVVNKRLFLFWPVFTEVPDEGSNATLKMPKLPGTTEGSFTPDKTKKKLRMQLNVSEYRDGKWSAKKTSKDFAESTIYSVEIVRRHYHFFPIDRSGTDGRFGIHFNGASEGSDGSFGAYLQGSFEITGCKGVPEIAYLPGFYYPVLRPEAASAGNETEFMKWEELLSRSDYPENDFTLLNLFSLTDDHMLSTPVLMQTPWLFGMTPPWHLSYLDKLWLDPPPFNAVSSAASSRQSIPVGIFLPFFYNDKNRTFFALPSLAIPAAGGDTTNTTATGTRLYYPEIKRYFRQWEQYFEGVVQTWADNFDLSTLTPDQRAQIEHTLSVAFPEEPVPPYSDAQLKRLMVLYIMRFYRLFLGQLALRLFLFRQFHFKNFYHPFVCDFQKLVLNPLKGIPALMSRDTQLKNSGFSFLESYQPTLWVVQQGTEEFYPEESVDFTPDGAYASYNWELFFHAPLLIANALSRNQRFEEARDWYHFIFNPIGVESSVPGGSVMSKYWITKPFFETTDPQYLQERIDNILRMLAGDTSVPGFSPQAKKELEDQVLDWRNNPFEPHRIAAYRTVAYQKTVVMKYLDNLINWGDFLFRQDSMESINEATQLYVLAAEILGPRPLEVPPEVEAPVETFNELESRFDTFSNALVEVENLVPVMPGNGEEGDDQPPLPTLYFCIPQNDKMLGYWDTVADRLYKIRHCMNIEGEVRQLSLFEPPIDPGALVKAVAGGVDLGSVLADLNAPLPLYRFTVLVQKANEFATEVKNLGSELLAALEKQDAEALGLLRQGQETALLEAMLAVRETQIDEAKENVETLNRTKAVTTERRDYYRDIQKISDKEQLQLDKLGDAQLTQELAQTSKLGASVFSLLPDINLGASGWGGSPVAQFKLGGLNLGQAANLASEVLALLSSIYANQSAMAGVKAGFDRRFDDWKLQERVADRELNQIDSQIAAANHRLDAANLERDNQALQIRNSKDTDAFLRSKFTGQELLQWQVGQISTTFFQAYKMAYDLAKRAERCFRFELGLQDASFISFGYWDSLKKGLLSGEKLQNDLRRMEAAYLEQNRREFEITKHVSLTLLDPLALVQLRETGRCFINLPEEIFDLDYPGQYFRRMKTVSITLPCVVGPYTTISCTLRLLKNSIRVNTASGDNGYPRNTDDQGLPGDDSRFIENNIPVKAIAASGAENDAGLFQLDFKDERYLPFEGAGVISQWSLELFNDAPANNPDPANPDFGKPLRQFDYGTISDALIHLKYTAREDAGSFKNGAVSHLRDYLSMADSVNLLRLFSLRQEFPSQWSRFLRPNNPADGNLFQLEMSGDLFRLLDKGKSLKVNKIWLLGRCSDPGNYGVIFDPPLPPPPPAGSDKMTLAPLEKFGGLHGAVKDVAALGIEVVPADPPVVWQLKMTRPGGGNLQQDPVTKAMEVEDLYLIVGYQWE